MVLVDTSIWSQALRRGAKHNKEARQKLSDLIAGNRAEIIGPIRQEILSGIRDEVQFKTLQGHLAAFPDIDIQPEKLTDRICFVSLQHCKGSLHHPQYFSSKDKNNCKQAAQMKEDIKDHALFLKIKQL